MFSLERTLIGFAIVAAVLTGTYVTGYWKGWNASEKLWLAEKSELIAATRLREERLRADGAEIEARLARAQANVKIKTVEVIREVVKYVRVDRPAFDNPDLTRLLNTSTGIRETVTRDGPGGPAATSREVAPDPAGSRTSEQALSTWIANTIDSHERCRLQANSLIQYVKACTAPP